MFKFCNDDSEDKEDVWVKKLDFYDLMDEFAF